MLRPSGYYFYASHHLQQERMIIRKKKGGKKEGKLILTAVYDNMYTSRNVCQLIILVRR